MTCHKRRVILYSFEMERQHACSAGVTAYGGINEVRVCRTGSSGRTYLKVRRCCSHATARRTLLPSTYLPPYFHGGFGHYVQFPRARACSAFAVTLHLPYPFTHAPATRRRAAMLYLFFAPRTSTPLYAHSGSVAPAAHHRFLLWTPRARAQRLHTPVASSQCSRCARSAPP